MRKICLLVLLCCVFTFQADCGGYEFKKEGLYAVVDTGKGKMTFELYYDKTPITVGNIVGLAEGTREFTDMKTREKDKRPYYDGLIFHRIIKGFVIQGGCPLGRGNGGPGYSFIDEIVPELKHDGAGILSMANSGPNTNGSQFFITLKPTPHLDGRHTVFGRIVHGEAVMRAIEEVQTGRGDKPVDDVEIESIKIVRVGEKAKAFNAEEEFAKNDEVLKALEEEQAKKLDEFLKKLGVKQSSIKATGSGLKYFVKRKGAGRKPKAGETIRAHYTGYLVNGTKFDSSRDRGKPFETAIGVRRVIPGWDEAFMNMRTGEKQILIIPPKLGYGTRGSPPVIPPNATLIFDVQLISVKK